MKRKRKDTMTGIAVGGIIGLTAVDAIPAPASASGIKASYATGVSNVGKVLPVMGNVKGTGMVLNSVGNLKKKSGKLMKGYKL